MESLEIIVLPVILVGALLLGAIWTTTAVHWLRSTKRLIGKSIYSSWTLEIAALDCHEEGPPLV